MILPRVVSRFDSASDTCLSVFVFVHVIIVITIIVVLHVEIFIIIIITIIVVIFITFIIIIYPNMMYGVDYALKSSIYTLPLLSAFALVRPICGYPLSSS